MAITNAHKQKRPVNFCECGDHAWVATTRGAVTLVSPEDADTIAAHRWSALRRSNGLVAVRRQNSGGYFYLHRVVTGAPDGKVVDHINHDTLDNRRRNLRICTDAENVRNQSPQRRKTASRFKGVWYDAQRGKWQAYVNVGKRRYHLGRFASEIEAALAYDAKALELHGEFAATNRTLGLLAS